MEDEEYKKLPLDERCVHKLWKARVNGYEEVTKLFRQIDDEKSQEFAKYLGLVKKFVTDSNAMGQEKGLEATLAFAENYAFAGKTVNEVMSGIVTKCMAAPKTKTRELALQVTLVYIEIEKQDAVMEELIKGLELKNPKIVTACLTTITTALREFGSKVIQLKPVVKKISSLFADRDKNVRDEARLLVIEMYRWIGSALKPQLSSLQPLQITELEAEFSKIEGQKASPTRFLRSQQEKQAKMAVEAAQAGECSGEEEDEVDDAVVVDAYEMADPVNILSKLPKDFYEKLEDKKWQERKEALETLENLLKAPKLESGDYGDLIRALRKMIQKDSNVVVVALAAKGLNGIASGLKKRFSTYATACIPILLEKFKEKKQNVVVALREAIDTIYMACDLENILDDVLEALANKNPTVKTETALFLSRAFTKTLPAIMNKKLLKAITGALIKLANEPDPAARDAGCEAIGTLMKLVGERVIAPFLVELEKDAKKMAKVKENCDKAVIVIKIPGAKKEKTSNKVDVPREAPKTSTAPPPKAVASKRPQTGPTKKTAGTKIVSGSATIVKSKGKPVKYVEKELCDDDVSEIVSELLPANVVTGLADAIWKTRLSSMETLLVEIQSMDSTTIPVQALLKLVCRKPGLKDTNFQVLKTRLDAIKFLAGTGKFSTTSATFCLNDITDKLGDAKNGTIAGETLTAIAEATSLNHVLTSVFDFAITQKSPKVLQETLLWIATAIKEFGFANLNSKFIIENAKKGLASSNVAVRANAVQLFGVLYLYMGPNIHLFLENEKPALRDQINIEFDKYENEKPPAPLRGVVKSASSNSIDDVDEDEGCGDALPVNVQDLLPRTDISSQITEALITEMADKNWKVRCEALTKVSCIINEAKLIKPNIGDLPQALALRLVDSNSKIAQTALNICEAIATAMGPPCKQYVRVLFPGFLQGLGDSKAWIRTSSVQCMNAYGDLTGYKDFFESEMIHDALKSGSPTLRSELWLWLSEKLPKIKQVPKEELIICIPYLYANMEDRNADVRKNAHEAIFGVMIHVGYETMVKQLEKLKPGSKNVVMTQLEKVRPNLPSKPSKAKKAAPNNEEKVVRSGGARPSTAKAVTKSVKPVAVKSASRSKKDEDVDTSPLLVVNNLKHQRTIDESKLKVLKWNFTSPRQEFVDLLRDQMTSANINKTLITNMFHADFKYHLKALEALSEDLPDNSQALISNLDLIFKWLTLRFFDTNPSVLLKGLEYLSMVFNMLIEHAYHIFEFEANCFIPYLITKIGDPKDAVRNGVKALIKQLWSVYPVNKLFSFLMEGLKSKNARQRAECLEAMGMTIANFGINICLPTPQACMKEIAKQFGDRDNTVRNAALNCAVQAYYIVGEKIFKMVGKISDKDMSLLEERIKRAGKKPPPPTQLTTTNVNKIDLTQTINPPHMNDHDPDHDDDEDIDQEQPEHDEIEDDNNMPEIALPSQVIERVSKRQKFPNPYELDHLLAEELNQMNEAIPDPKLEAVDLGFLNEDVKIPSMDDSRQNVKLVMPLSPPKPILTTDVLSHPRQTSIKSPDMLSIEKNLQYISGSSITKAFEAVVALDALMRTNKVSLFIDYEDTFMNSISGQLVHLKAYDPSTNATAIKLYRNLLTLFELFFLQPTLGKKISTAAFKVVLKEFLRLLADEAFENVKGKESYIRVLNFHCVKLIERCDHTNCICGLVQILEECVRSQSNARFTELIMKCLWRVIKNIPTWEDDLDCERVLLDIHKFLKAYPSSYWKNMPSDTPIRTIKTILHSIVKIKGAGITEHLSNIPNVNQSELEIFIHKMIRTWKLAEVKQVPLKTEPRKMLPRSSHTQLTDIFQKIGSREETNEGLNLLYDFLQQNPQSDIEPFLKRSSDFFQKYIQKNLKEIEMQRKNPSAYCGGETKETNKPMTPVMAKDFKDVNYYCQQLNKHKESWDKDNGNMDLLNK